MQGLSPVVGIAIILMGIPIKKQVLKLIKISLALFGAIYFIVGYMNYLAVPDYWQVMLYSITISLFIHLLQGRNPDKGSKVLGVSLIVSHLFSQWWEIPLFIIVHLGLLGYGYFGSMDQLYLILVFYMALRFTNISIAKSDLILLLIPLVFTSLAFYFRPVIIYYVNPLWFFARALSCFCLGRFFIERSELN